MNQPTINYTCSIKDITSGEELLNVGAPQGALVSVQDSSLNVGVTCCGDGISRTQRPLTLRILGNSLSCY